VIKAVGHYTNITFVIDPRVKGTLTLVSEKPVTKSQAFSLLTSALRLQGYAVVTGDGYAKVVPEADAKLQSGRPRSASGADPDQGRPDRTQIFHLQLRIGRQRGAVLRPLISPNNTINANPATTAWWSPTTPTTCAAWPRSSPRSTRRPPADLDVIPIRYAIASDVATLVTRLMEPSGAGGDAGRSRAGRSAHQFADRARAVGRRAPTWPSR
jgi:general secretion pathway protein D